MLRNIFRNHSIKRSMIVFVAVIVFIPMVATGIYFYAVVSSILSNQLLNKLNDFTNETNKLIYSQFESTSNLFFNLINSKDITRNLSLLKTNNVQSATQIKIRDTLQRGVQHNLFFNYAWESGLINSIFMFNVDEKDYFYLRYDSLKLINTENYSELVRKHRNQNSRFEIIPPTAANPTLFYIRNFFDENDSSLKGTIVLDINENIISKTYEGISQYTGSQGMIFNNDGIVVSATDKSMLGKKAPSELLAQKLTSSAKQIKINNERFWIAAKEINGYDLTSLIIVPEKSVFLDLNKSIRDYLYIIALLVIVFVVIGIFYSTHVIRHIKDLIEKMEKVQKGNYNARMGGYKEIELIRLSNIFNKMINRIDYLFNEVYNNQLLIKEAELKSLQAQINPHFLFNVLLTIGWKAKMSNNDTIYKMVSSLSELLQASIYTDSSQTTTIREEMKYVEYYLYLQKERFGDKFTIQVNIDQSIMDYSLPKLCIQPIVENAIVHGLENKIAQGNLYINAYEDFGIINIEIADDGVGFDTAELDLAGNSKAASRKHKKNHTHIGLINVNKRMKFMYGEKYEIAIRSEQGKGTTVAIRIPAQQGGAPFVSGHDSR
ncbi:histidine kinase [Paenibacillus sp. GCM10027626]|uniref:sensor histidine kinase n=1 Tax=Paenibacillus sp. GCM10027626 TaxID=3273411 RepID=UPI0036337765